MIQNQNNKMIKMRKKNTKEGKNIYIITECKLKSPMPIILINNIIPNKIKRATMVEDLVFLYP